eukprot:scaffold13594_cov66-Phaeocystis_antarctica.AAC.4
MAATHRLAAGLAVAATLARLLTVGNKGDNLCPLVIDLADGPSELVVQNERHAEGPRGGRCLGIGAHLGREDRPTNLKRSENETVPLHGRVARAFGAVLVVVDVDSEVRLDPVDDCLGLDGHRVDGSSGSGAFFEGEVIRGGGGVVGAEVRVRRRVPCEGPLADRPVAVVQAEVLAHHIVLKPPLSSVLGDVTVRGLPPACVMVVSPSVMLICRPCQVLPTRSLVALGGANEALNEATNG